MFDEISPTYDKLNHLLSGYQDNRWRKMAVKHLAGLSSDNRKILDLASGSGDLGLEFLKLLQDELYSVDLSEEMLKINRSKIQFENNFVIKADAEGLPFKNNYFDVCGIGFGVRNFQNLETCIKEINRVLKPGGRFATIEMFKPHKKTFANNSFRMYFEKILPKIGNSIAGSTYAYDYLFQSVNSFLTVKQYTELLENCGFRVLKSHNNFLGIVHTVFAQKV